MKSFRLISVFLLLFFIISAFVPATEEAFVSKKGRFSIVFKEKPAQSSKMVPTAIGKVKLYLFMYEESHTKAFMVAYCDYPKKLIREADPMELLRGSKGGVIDKFEATVTHEEEHAFMGYPCIDFAASGPKYNTQYKLVLVNNRLYQVGILSESSIKSTDIDSFIKTFELLD